MNTGENPSKASLIIVVSFLILFTVSNSSAFYLPDTGQTKCYNSTAKTITCPAPGESLAQDGSYSINPPSYIVNPDGTVFDNNTWLTWQQTDDGQTKTWEDAKSYCKNLTFSGHDDWRLPTKKELESIVNYGEYNPAIDLQIFPNTKTGNYLSDTSYAGDMSKTWIVSFTNGSMSASANTTSAYARCVRGGPLEYDDFDFTVYPPVNRSTNLMWAENIPNARGLSTMTWGDALAACESYSNGSYSDWRLPNVKELESFTDDMRSNPSVDKGFSRNISSSNYWTSTTNTSSVDQSWAVSFQDGSVSSIKKGDRYTRAICVQTGQNNQLDSQEIKVSPAYLDFGYVKAEVSNAIDLSISNTGRDILTIGNIVYPLAPFSIIYDGCSGHSLSVWESCIVTINILPTSIGIYTDSITIPSNDQDQPNLSVKISATATANGSTFLLPDTALQYCFKSLYPWLSAWYFTGCSGLPQDASYHINALNYNVLDTDILTERNTGLMWQRTDDGVRKPWDEAVNYCKDLNLGGYTGWRLPSRTELFSILDLSHKGGYTDTGSPKRTLAPRINAGAFPGAEVSSPESTYNFWTSSESEESKAMSWAVSFVYGTSALMNKEYSQYTRCVRGGSLPSADLSYNGNGTLTDMSTSHMWQQGEGGEMTWTNAAVYCENLSLGGYWDWRLPNVKELEYISRSNEEFFPAIQNSGYWSSTTNMYSSSAIWLDSFEYAYVVDPQGEVNDRHRGFGDGEAIRLVRCVRAGNPSLLADGRIISVYPNFLDFGTINNGASKLLGFIVKNMGTADLKINYLYIKNSSFSIASENCSGITLLSGDSCSVTIKFSPTTEGTFNSWLYVNSNDADNPYAYVNMTGTAILASSASLTGTVTNAASGTTLSNVSVTVTDSSSTKTAVTNSNGTYTITGLAEGSYTAVFSKSGYIIQTVSGTLLAGQTQTLDIQLNSAPELTISITSPVNNSVLNASPITVIGSVSNSANVTVNGVQATVSNGTFTASVSLSEGQNTITATATDQYSQTAAQSINVTLVTKGSISGTVTDSMTGLPVQSASVSVTDSLNITQTAATDVNGTYIISNISQGAFSSSITKEFYLDYTFTGMETAGQITTVNASLNPSPPVISNIAINNITTDSAAISWTTNQPSSTVFEYGATSSYGNTFTDPTLTTGYNVTLNSLLPATTYHFRITSTNAYGISSSSGNQTFTTLSPPPVLTLAISSPSNNSTINKPDIMVKGTITNTIGNETGITVNGIPAVAYGDTFTANHVPLTDGVNTITVTATDTAGNTATSSINVNAVTTGNYVRLNSNIESGIAPLEVSLRIDIPYGYTNQTLTAAGPVQPEFLSVSSSEATVRMTVEGIYYFTASATGTDNIVYQDTVAITVLNKTQLDTLLRGKWEGMKEKLLAGNIETALTYFVEGSIERYRQAFADIGSSSINSKFSSIIELRFNSFYGPIAQYWALREEPDGTFAYPITFFQDTKGIWKIMGF